MEKQKEKGIYRSFVSAILFFNREDIEETPIFKKKNNGMF